MMASNTRISSTNIEPICWRSRTIKKGLAVAPQWTVVTPEKIESTAKATLKLDDQSILVSEILPRIPTS